MQQNSFNARDVERLVFTIAEILQEKNRGFCVYRFPNEQQVRLAIEEDVLEGQSGDFFWMTPFSEQSQAREVRWAIVQVSQINDALLARIQQLDVCEPVSQEQFPSEISFSQYRTRFNAYLNDINEQQLGKAILSRSILHDKPADFRAIDLFQKLKQRYPDTFVYLAFHPSVGKWMGASPELLVEKKGKVYSVMALAGTQPYVTDEPVSWNLKEQEEHEMVVQHVESILEKHHVTVLEKKGPDTWHLKRLLHLRTDFLVEESEPLALVPFLKDLHPTPAVGGLPVQKALDCIEKHEGYDRTYYSGIIGETNFKDSCRLYINLRCMQIGENKIAIYVGGGLTASSEVDQEWEETILKSRTMLDVIQ